MKKIFLILLLLICILQFLNLCVVNNSFAGYIQKKLLQVVDVENFINSNVASKKISIYNGFIKIPFEKIQFPIKILGIHQKENVASVYIFVTIKDRHINSVRNDINLIRFNSGKWFLPKFDIFLKTVTQ